MPALRVKKKRYFVARSAGFYLFRAQLMREKGNFVKEGDEKGRAGAVRKIGYAHFICVY